MRYFWYFLFLYTSVFSQTTLDEHLTEELNDFTNWGSNNSARRVSFLGPRAVTHAAEILKKDLRFINFNPKQELVQLTLTKENK